MPSSLTGEPRPVDDRAPRSTLAFALVLALVDEALVLVAPRLPEVFLASRASETLRGLTTAAVLLGPALAFAIHRRALRPADAWLFAVLVAERAACASTHRPWAPGGFFEAREALVAAVSTVKSGVPVGGIGAFALAFALAGAAWTASSVHFARALSKVFVALTLLFAGGATLVYASGAGEAWLEPTAPGASAPCPAPREASEPPKEMQNGSENRDPK